MNVQATEINEEVFFSTTSLSTISRSDITDLKSKAQTNKRERIRLCTHRSTEEFLHEMFIVHSSSTYVRPHKHLHKAVSHHIIEGSVDFVVFDDEGEIIQVVDMGDYSSGRRFYHRISEPHFYALIIKSDTAVFHETITGPFHRDDTEFGPWSPDENDHFAVTHYMKQIEHQVNVFRSFNEPDAGITMNIQNE